MIRAEDELKYEKLREYLATIRKKEGYYNELAESYPEGKLIISNSGKYRQFHVRTSNIKTISMLKSKGCRIKTEKANARNEQKVVFYLRSSEEELATQFLKREELEVKISVLKITEKHIEKYLESIEETLELSKSFYDNKVRVELLDKEEAQKRAKLTAWANADYEHNEEHPENLKYPTKGGFNVRSKSEVMIANELITRRIPFRYEQRVWANGNKHHPDFLIIHPVTDKVYIWEHNGMMDSPRYIRKASLCLKDYSSEGFLLDDDLIFTNESNTVPLTIEQVESKIRAILLDKGIHRNNDARCLMHCMPAQL